MSKDPTEPLRLKASTYPGVDQGTACTQSSFKAGKKAFLFVGPQGGRFKAMFKLGPSRAQAEALADKHPDRFDVGSSAWVTARFTAQKPMPKKLWTAWLDESYALTTAPKAKKKAKAKKSAKKKAVKKKTAKKKTAKKTPTARATKTSAKKKKAVKKRKSTPRKRTSSKST